MPVSRVRKGFRTAPKPKTASLARAMERNRNRLAYFAGLRKNRDIGIDPKYRNGGYTSSVASALSRAEWLKDSKAWDAAEVKRWAARRAA